MESTQEGIFFEKVIEIFKEAKLNLKTAVNITMVYAYY